MQKMQETWAQSLGWEDPLEKGMATYSSILAWRIPWTEEPGGLQSIGLQSQTWLKPLSTHTCELSCSTWDLVPWLGMEPRPPTSGTQSLNFWTTREVPEGLLLIQATLRDETWWTGTHKEGWEGWGFGGETESRRGRNGEKKRRLICRWKSWLQNMS